MTSKSGPISVVTYGEGKKTLSDLRQIISADAAVRFQRAQGAKTELFVRSYEGSATVENLEQTLGLVPLSVRPTSKIAEYVFNILKEKDLLNVDSNGNVFLDANAFADGLLAGLDTLSKWPTDAVNAQRKAIGGSHGVCVQFPISGISETIPVFTTRPDTLFGAIFVAISPAHPIVATLGDTLREGIARTFDDAGTRDATGHGVDTGLRVIHPFDKKRTVPVWLADFVEEAYGWGALFGGPCNQRDLNFARKHGLRAIPVVCPPGKDPETFQVGDVAHAGEGTMINSGFLNGSHAIDEATALAIDKLESMKMGYRTTQYRLRPWVIATSQSGTQPKFSRFDEDFEFSASFYLAASLLFEGAHEPTQVHALHVSSAEGYVRHLLDVRVLAHALSSVGVAVSKEPISKLLIAGAVDGEINLIENDPKIAHWADAIRAALLANVALGRPLNWKKSHIHSADRLLSKLVQLSSTDGKDAADVDPTELNNKLADISCAYRIGAYHKAISSFHGLSKMKFGVDQICCLKNFAKVLEPLAPATARRLWEALTSNEPIERFDWPQFLGGQEEVVRDLMLMINGKRRGSIRIPAHAEQDDIKSLIDQSDMVENLIKGRPIARIVHVPNRLINLVVS